LTVEGKDMSKTFTRYFFCLTAIVAGLTLAAAGVSLAGKKTDKKEDKMASTSCVATAKGPLAPEVKPGAAESAASQAAAASVVRARVGQPAPDFEANAFIGGGFKNLKLSDYKGKKWVVLCFYPGDFTFV
jgi:hypothetical protein